MTLSLRIAAALLACSLHFAALAAGGPLGIDHRWNLQDSGIWKRNNQNILRYGGLYGSVGFALWEGGESRIGKTAWQSVDSVVVSQVVAESAKPAFGRVRPRDANDPNEWFKNGRSFPSGEVAGITGIITPYVLEYGHDNPHVYALELLPAYDAIARMKVQAHWQTDVLAGFALGTAAGYLAHERASPLILGVLPSGFMVGLKRQF
jgi:undecaprenyl-diphosphatase